VHSDAFWAQRDAWDVSDGSSAVSSRLADAGSGSAADGLPMADGGMGVEPSLTPLPMALDLSVGGPFPMHGAGGHTGVSVSSAAAAADVGSGGAGAGAGAGAAAGAGAGGGGGGSGKHQQHQHQHQQQSVFVRAGRRVVHSKGLPPAERAKQARAAALAQTRDHMKAPI
jgi:hypothetical protein